MESKYIWKADNNGGIRRYRRKKQVQNDESQLESYIEMSDLQVLDTISGSDRENTGEKDINAGENDENTSDKKTKSTS